MTAEAALGAEFTARAGCGGGAGMALIAVNAEHADRTRGAGTGWQKGRRAGHPPATADGEAHRAGGKREGHAERKDEGSPLSYRFCPGWLQLQRKYFPENQGAAITPSRADKSQRISATRSGE